MAQGASLIAASLEGKNELLLIDVAPTTYSVEMLHGLLEALIPRNTSLPALNNTLSVTARSLATGEQVAVEIQALNHLSEEKMTNVRSWVKQGLRSYASFRSETYPELP